MEKDLKAKFWEQIKLTQNADDKAALVALRKAQEICSEAKINFYDYLFLNGDTMGSRFRSLQRDYNKTLMRCNQLWDENMDHTLRRGLKGRGRKKDTPASSVTEKIKKIAQQNNELKKEVIHAKSEMYDHQNRCDELLMLLSPDKEKRKQEKLRTFEVFMKSIEVIKSKKFWIATEDLYKRYTGHWWDLPAIKKREFSMLFSKSLNLKPVKGGKNKDIMGYNVIIDYNY